MKQDKGSRGRGDTKSVQVQLLVGKEKRRGYGVVQNGSKGENVQTMVAQFRLSQGGQGGQGEVLVRAGACWCRVQFRAPANGSLAPAAACLLRGCKLSAVSVVSARWRWRVSPSEKGARHHTARTTTGTGGEARPQVPLGNWQLLALQPFPLRLDRNCPNFHRWSVPLAKA